MLLFRLKFPVLMAAAFLVAGQAAAQSARNVLLVVNRRSAVSSQIASYYAEKRHIPAANVCSVDTAEREEITRSVYDQEVERPIAACLRDPAFRETILYIAMAMGVPLRVAGGGTGIAAEQSSVDSELTLLYQRLQGKQTLLAGPVANPFFGHVDAAFRHPNFPVYLVTRLAGFDFADVRGLIDRSVAEPANSGKWVVDLRADNNTEGNGWLRAAARQLPRDRLTMDETAAVVQGLKGVIGYASWGSNDGARHSRTPRFEWLPGAIATEFVSTSARTFTRPPQAWTVGNWHDARTWFAGSPQDLSADFVHEGVTGVSGNVYEPFLFYCARPDYVLPAYASGRNLAESFYLGLAGLSWQGVVIGDPLCKLRE